MNNLEKVSVAIAIAKFESDFFVKHGKKEQNLQYLQWRKLLLIQKAKEGRLVTNQVMLTLT
jgi:hypothetical protein